MGSSSAAREQTARGSEVSMNFADCEKESELNIRSQNYAAEFFAMGVPSTLTSRLPAQISKCSSWIPDWGGRNGVLIMEQGKIA